MFEVGSVESMMDGSGGREERRGARAI